MCDIYLSTIYARDSGSCVRPIGQSGETKKVRLVLSSYPLASFTEYKTLHERQCLFSVTAHLRHLRTLAVKSLPSVVRCRPQLAVAIISYHMLITPDSQLCSCRLLVIVGRYRHFFQQVDPHDLILQSRESSALIISARRPACTQHLLPSHYGKLCS